ncbi:hypothetical protein HanHA89_Chr02g0080621 [Helianthus annuus]|nr:hypothetical protein HanHA89_Chr02g0080621 [Helianthus annuus]
MTFDPFHFKLSFYLNYMKNKKQTNCDPEQRQARLSPKTASRVV